MRRSAVKPAPTILRMRTRIKICGLKTSEHVDAAVDAGADAIGFVLYPPSVRAIDLALLASLTQRVPAFVSTVALFVNPSPDEVRDTLVAARIDLLQFHGAAHYETPEFCAQFGRPFMKAFAVDNRFDLLKSQETYANAAALLLDTPSAGHGGSGQTFDWNLIPCQQPNNTTNPSGAPAPRVVLSGGLTAANVADAINAIRPFAVDVSSGVESARGVKDSELIYKFCREVAKTFGQDR
ncbi:MAG: phosphoribosylanthranilate isomerase [Burkholderiales bacterium]|nr:MAG: phosphoribosylanthranilate isomerase [Burkholderiales bacterium]